MRLSDGSKRRYDESRKKSASARSRRKILLSCAAFISFVAICSLLSLTPMCRELADSAAALYAKLAALLLGLIGMPVQVDGAQLGTDVYTVVVEPGCLGFEYLWFIWGIVMLFPSSAKYKILGIALSALLFASLNVIRIASLFLIGLKAPGLFNVIHRQVWATAFVLVAAYCCIIWADITARKAARDELAS